MRAQRGRIGGLAMLTIIFVIGYSGYLFGPPYWDYKMMRKICRDAVLTYHTSGTVGAAQSRYKIGLEKERIPMYIEERDCHFRESGSDFTVECEWVAPIVIPILDIDMSKAYRFRTAISKDGNIREF